MKQVNPVDEVGQKVIVREGILRAALLWRSVNLQQQKRQCAKRTRLLVLTGRHKEVQYDQMVEEYS